MTDFTEPLLRSIQVESLGQQKVDGKSPPHCCRLVFPPHASARGNKMLDACVAVMNQMKKHRIDILESLGDAVLGAIVWKM